MAISAIQQEGFAGVPAFGQQVEVTVKQQAVDQSEKLAAMDPPDPLADNKNVVLRQVVKTPAQYGFVDALLADSTWDVTFDAWAADPKTADYLILSLVQKHWALMTALEFLQP
jgi:hypothetical protein